MSDTNIPTSVDLLPYHLRPEVLEQQRLEHPHLFAPQAEDWNNEFYGRNNYGGKLSTRGVNTTPAGEADVRER